MYRLSALALLLFLALNCYGQQAPLKINFVVSEMTETTVDVDLVVEDFTDVTLIQLFMFWDESVLEVDQQINANPDLPGFLSILPEEDMADPSRGKLRINWFDGIGVQTLADNTVLCSYRFNILGDECSTTDFTIGDLGDAMTSPSLVIDVQAINTSGIEQIGLETVTPLTYTVPGSGCESTSTEETEIASVRIYPNPVRDNLQVSFNNHQPDESSIMIYNEEGRLLSQNQLRNTESNIDISDINNGIYFYEIQDKGIVVNTGKIMKI
jgi:hypothetical protein